MNAAPEILAHPATLESDRLRLRAFRPDDFEDFYAVHSDPRVQRYWSFPAWTERAQAQDYFASALAGRDPEVRLCWAIARREDDRLIGATTLYAINRPQGRCELGYALASAQWGQGYAGDALGLVLDHAFGPLALRRVEADVDPRNTASCRLLERLGFVHEGHLRERWHVAGEVCDTALYGVLARDWRARRSP